MTLELAIPEVDLPTETDEKTLQVIEGIRRLQELVPTISELKTIPELQNIKRNCRLIHIYAQDRDLNKELVLWAKRCALLCERRIGEMLIAMKERKELRGRGKPPPKKADSGKVILDAEENKISEPVTIKELGLSENESSNAQALASVPEPVFGEIIDKQIDIGKLSTKAVVREARQRVQAKGVVKLNRPYVKRPGKKLSLFWTRVKKALDELSLQELEKLSEYWQKTFAEYLSERKAKLEKQKIAFGVNKEPEQIKL